MTGPDSTDSQADSAGSIPVTRSRQQGLRSEAGFRTLGPSPSDEDCQVLEQFGSVPNARGMDELGCRSVQPLGHAHREGHIGHARSAQIS